MAHPNLSHANQAQFDAEVLQASSAVPVLVDFWAEWCGPCKSLAPVLEQLADKHPESLKIVKVDTDAEAELAAQYGVRSLPTLMLFRDGQSVAQVVGAQPLSALDEFVSEWLPRATDAFIKLAKSSIEQGDIAAAIATLEQALAADPLDFRIHPLLGELYLDCDRSDAARQLVADLPANIAIDHAFSTLKSRLSMAEVASQGDDASDPVAATFAAAVASANAGDYEAGVTQLLALLPAERSWRDGIIAKTLVDIFNVLETDPRVRDWRRQMARTLN